MTKKVIWDSTPIGFEGRVVDLIDCLQQVKDKYGEDAYVEIGYDCENIDYILKFQREETEKEYQKRLKKEEKQKEAKRKDAEKKKEKELKEYNRLKKLYGESE